MAAAAVANNYSDYTFSETLDTSGNTTSWVECRNWMHHTIAFTTPAGLTGGVVQVQGSLDGTRFFGIDPSGNISTYSAGTDNSGNVAFTKPAATYAIRIMNCPINWIRLRLVSYTGTGSTLSITPIIYRGG